MKQSFREEGYRGSKYDHTVRGNSEDTERYISDSPVIYKFVSKVFAHQFNEVDEAVKQKSCVQMFVGLNEIRQDCTFSFIIQHALRSLYDLSQHKFSLFTAWFSKESLTPHP